MCQQLNCSVERGSFENPSGCNGKLFSWVEVTVGAGTNGEAQAPLCASDNGAPPCFTTNYLPGVPKASTTGEGSTALGFYNVQQGDAPYFKELADKYAMSDNFHQSVQGGTGANHIMFGHGDAIWFSDAMARRLSHPRAQRCITPGPDAGVVNEVENPIQLPAPITGTPKMDTAMAATRLSATLHRSPVSGGGSYSDCSDTTSRRGQNRPATSSPSTAYQSALRKGPLLSAQQLQSRAISGTATMPIPTRIRQHPVYDSTVVDSQHRRRLERA